MRILLVDNLASFGITNPKKQIGWRGCGIILDKEFLDVSDSFIVAALLPALVEGEDIQVESVSGRLYYNFGTLAFLQGKVFGYPPIRLHARNIESVKYGASGVGAGFSGGVDSFCTYVRHTSDACPETMRITHLALVDVGAYGNDYEKTRLDFETDLERSAKFADEVGKPLIPVDSNISSIYTHKDIYHYSLRATLCVSSPVVDLQKLFSLIRAESLKDFEPRTIACRPGRSLEDAEPRVRRIICPESPKWGGSTCGFL